MPGPVCRRRNTLKHGLDVAGFVVMLVFFGPVVFMLVTSHRVGVRTQGRTLIINGNLRTTRINTDDIEDFRLVKLHGRSAALCVIRKIGTITDLPSVGQTFWGVGRGVVEQRAERLCRWHHSTLHGSSGH